MKTKEGIRQKLTKLDLLQGAERHGEGVDQVCWSFQHFYYTSDWLETQLEAPWLATRSGNIPSPWKGSLVQHRMGPLIWVLLCTSINQGHGRKQIAQSNLATSKVFNKATIYKGISRLQSNHRGTPQCSVLEIAIPELCDCPRPEGMKAESGPLEKNSHMAEAVILVNTWSHSWYLTGREMREHITSLHFSFSLNFSAGPNQKPEVERTHWGWPHWSDFWIQNRVEMDVEWMWMGKWKLCNCVCTHVHAYLCSHLHIHICTWVCVRLMKINTFSVNVGTIQGLPPCCLWPL